nr:FGGY-family carbohydrate kinase [Mycoplasmopsis cynos]
MGAIFGLERGTKREHIVKATLDSIAYQSNDLLKAMEKDLEKPIILLKVDGGASKSNYLMQFQSSISNLNVERPSKIETTGLGASYLAGLAVGYWKDLEELKTLNKPEKVFEPLLSKTEIDKLLKGWDLAVRKTLNWTKDIE